MARISRKVWDPDNQVYSEACPCGNAPTAAWLPYCCKIDWDVENMIASPGGGTGGTSSHTMLRRRGRRFEPSPYSPPPIYTNVFDCIQEREAGGGDHQFQLCIDCVLDGTCNEVA